MENDNLNVVEDQNKDQNKLSATVLEFATHECTFVIMGRDLNMEDQNTFDVVSAFNNFLSQFIRLDTYKTIAFKIKSKHYNIIKIVVAIVNINSENVSHQITNLLLSVMNINEIDILRDKLNDDNFWEHVNSGKIDCVNNSDINSCRCGKNYYSYHAVIKTVLENLKYEDKFIIVGKDVLTSISRLCSSKSPCYSHIIKDCDINMKQIMTDENVDNPDFGRGIILKTHHELIAKVPLPEIKNVTWYDNYNQNERRIGKRRLDRGKH